MTGNRQSPSPEDPWEREETAGRPPETDPLADILEAFEIMVESPGGLDMDDLRQLVDTAQARATAEAMASLEPLSRALAGNLNLDSVVRELLDHAIRVAHAERGILFLCGDSSDADDALRPAVARGMSGSDLEQLGSISRTVLAQALSGQTVLTIKALEDPHFSKAESIRANKIPMVACLPLRHAGRVIGLLYCDGHNVKAMLNEQVHRTLGLLAGIAAAAIENARVHGRLLSRNSRLLKQLQLRDPFNPLVTIDPAMMDLKKRAAMMARLDQPVLILGESGTGKELIAQALHKAGPRRSGRFVAHNCASVTRELAEDAYFGHEAGAYTGATKPRDGLFRQADGGTLFLDEIGELSLENQARLLRVTEDGKVRPLGAVVDTQVDTRIIAATNRDLKSAMDAGLFLEPLYYRLCVLTLRVPPLRERPADIPVLIRHFLDKHAGMALQPGERVFTRAALEYLVALAWQGNVRVLESFVQRVLSFAPPGEVDLPEVRELLVGLSGEDSRGTGRGAGASQGPEALPAETGARVRRSARIPPRASYRSMTMEKRRARVLVALDACSGNQTRAARQLGCHRNTLRRWVRDLAIDE